MMQDWVGWLLMLFSFSIVLMWKSVRSDTKLVLAIWFCIVAHHVVALLNAYVCHVMEISDATMFHGSGAILAVSPELMGDHQINYYTQFLGFMYRSTLGASLFFGEELSVLAFTMSCVVLVKLVDLLDLGRFRIGIILLFGLLPSAVIFRSLTMRESWQTLFFLLSVYWAVRLRKRPDILTVSFLLMSACCMALTHHGMARYAVYLVVISVIWGILGRKKCVRWVWHVRLLFVGLLIACVIISSQKMGWFMTLGEALEDGTQLRQTLLNIEDVRTNNSFILDTSSVFGIVTTVPMVFTEYMFAPFLWQVEGVKDVCILLESILRFALLLFAVYSWRRSSGELRSFYSYLLIAVLSMEFVWAFGTVNWGTAVRHRVPGYSVLVLLGAPGFILFMRRFHFETFGRRKDNTMLPK